MASSNNNPTGINQYKDCPSKGDEKVSNIIREYHRRGITNRQIISDLLKVEHDIQMSQASVARRLKDLELYAAGITTRRLPESTKRQLVLDQLGKDPVSSRGPKAVKEAITRNTGIHLTRSFIREEMHLQDPDGFIKRLPSAKKIRRGVLTSLGPNHEWSADGHDKLTAIGFPIYGIRDKWSGKWLGLWVVPNNRIKEVIAYLYLSLVAELKGMPIQSTTDCGSETTMFSGLAEALREAFASELNDVGIGPAHQFLRSVKNITIERGWLRLRMDWVDNVKVEWAAGSDIYNSGDPKQYELVQWLWPRLIQQELDTFRDHANNHTVRLDRHKALPSGTSPNIAYSLCHKWGGENCLKPVDVAVVKRLMDEVGGDGLIQFVTPEYAEKAQAIYDALDIQNITFENVWGVFSRMLLKM
ncbi:hypothetical protein BDN72DRAFT_966259 [Pluteus cervinus]|uniref:Uncharacterized protein n=1 Tax=Pluteus cervinus TaxID=181527 RepID=A0ACD2ZZB0_9AGAR|nr:hypothetical protein BDN72DRAFT_966259 [Pluteus cervinus]